MDTVKGLSAKHQYLVSFYSSMLWMVNIKSFSNASYSYRASIPKSFRANFPKCFVKPMGRETGRLLW